MVILIGLMACAQSMGQDWDFGFDFFGKKKQNYTPITLLADTIQPLSPYTNGWATFNGTNQFMRSRDIEAVEFIGSDSFSVEIRVSFGLPRKAMYICGKFNDANIGWAFIFNNTGDNIVYFRFNAASYQIDTVSATDSTSWFAYKVKYNKAAQTLKVYENEVLKQTYTSFTYTSSNNPYALVVGHAKATTNYSDPTDGTLNPTSVYARMKMDYLYIHNYQVAVDSACIYDFDYISSQMAYDRETYLLIDGTTPDGYRPGSHLCNGVNPGTDSCDAVFSAGYRKGLTNVTALSTGLNKWGSAPDWYGNSFTNGQTLWKTDYDVFSGEINRYDVTPGVWTNDVDTSNNIVAWNNTLEQFEPIGSRQAFTGVVTAVHPYGDSLLAGGVFLNAKGLANADYVAIFRGTDWDSLGRGLNNSVNCFATVNGKIHAGGYFDSSGTTRILSNVAQWDYTGWSAVGTNDIGVIWSLEVYNGIEYAGTQNGLYWLNGTTWTLVTGTSSTIYCMEVYKNELWFGGIGVLAKYNGTTVTSMGLMEGFEGHMIEFATDGVDLFGVGSFYRIILNGKNVVCNKLARFNGAQWSAINYGADFRPEGVAYRLKVADKILVLSGDNYVVDGVLSQNAVHINLSMSLTDTSHVQFTHTALTDTAEFNFPLTVTATAIKANGTEIDSAYMIWSKGINGTANSISLTQLWTTYTGQIAPDTSTTVTGDTIFYTLYARDMNSVLTTGSTNSFIILGNPTDYRTGLVLNLDADTNVTSNTPVVTWGNIMDTLTLRQGTAGDRPVHVPNILNGGVIRFASSDFLTFTQLALTNFTITFAFKSRENIDNYILSNASMGAWVSLSASGYGFGLYDGTRVRGGVTTGLDTNWKVCTMTNSKIFINGVEISYATAQTLLNFTIDKLGGNASFFFKGDLKRLRVYNTTLSATNRIIEESAVKRDLGIY